MSEWHEVKKAEDSKVHVHLKEPLSLPSNGDNQFHGQDGRKADHAFRDHMVSSYNRTVFSASTLLSQSPCHKEQSKVDDQPVNGFRYTIVGKSK